MSIPNTNLKNKIVNYFKHLIKSESGVSEIVDMVLIFAVIITIISMVFYFGYPAVQESKQNLELTQSIDDFIVLGNEINSVMSNKYLSKDSNMQLNDGSLSTSNGHLNATIVMWNETTKNKKTKSVDFETKSLNYKNEDNLIIYQNTGIFRKHPNGYTEIKNKPMITLNNNHLVLPLGVIKSNTSLSGRGPVNVETRFKSDEIYNYNSVSNLTINAKSECYKGWGKYLNKTLNMDVIYDNKNNTVIGTKSYSPDNITVTFVSNSLKVNTT